MRTRAPNGQGTFVKRSDTHYEWRQDIDGHRRTISAISMKELKEKVLRVRDRPYTPTKITVDEWFRLWLIDYVEALKKEATHQQYNAMYEKHISPIIGKRKLVTIKSHDIQGIIASANKKGLSTWTMKHIRKVANLGFSQAVQNKVIGESPVKEIEVPKKQPKERKVLTPSEINTVEEALSKSRWRASIRFLLATGMRRGELLALKWDDIMYDAKRIRVKSSLGRKGVSGDTKSAEIHFTPLSTVALTALELQKQILIKEGNPAVFCKENDEKAFVFPNKYGEAMHPQSYLTMLAKLFDNKPWLDKVHVYPHALRHTFVYLNRGAMDLKDLQNVLGHSESTTTLDIYGDMLSENANEVAAAVDGVFKKLDDAITKSKEKKAGNMRPYREKAAK